VCGLLCLVCVCVLFISDFCVVCLGLWSVFCCGVCVIYVCVAFIWVALCVVCRVGGVW